MTDFGIEDYLATVGANSETIDHYRRRLKSMETWTGQDGQPKPLASLSFADLDRLKARLRSMKSGAHYATILKAFYRAAGMEDHRRRCTYRRPTRPALMPEEILTVPEVQRMVDATGPTRDRALIACLYETGVRVSELLSLNLGHVHRKEANGGPAMYVLSFHKSKVRGQEHQGFIIESVPLFESFLKARLTMHAPRDEGAPLFVNFNGTARMDRRGAWNVVTGAAKRAEIGKKVWPHLFRHSRATHLLARGVPPAQVEKLLGWKPGTTMLARYSHLANADAERALLKANGFEVPESVDIGRLDFPDESLHPIVPVPTPPGGEEDEEVMRLVWMFTRAIEARPELFERVLGKVVKHLEGGTKPVQNNDP